MKHLTETQRAALVVVLKAGQGALGDTVNRVSTGRITAKEWAELANALDYLRSIVKHVGLGETPDSLGT